jgi:hypothetical protein
LFYAIINACRLQTTGNRRVNECLEMDQAADGSKQSGEALETFMADVLDGTGEAAAAPDSEPASPAQVRVRNSYDTAQPHATVLLAPQTYSGLP